MHLAIIGDDSLPNSTLVHAKMLHELASELKKQGHTVVIIAPGKPKQEKRLDISSLDGNTYWKFKSGKLRGEGKFKRAINETLLSFNAWLAIPHIVEKEPFDGVIYYSPSIFFGPLVNKIKAKNRCKSYLILRDMFPQWAVDEGLIKKGSLIEKYFCYFENVNYCASDSIGLMSPKNLTLFTDKHQDKFNTHVLYNWADTTASLQRDGNADLRETYGLQGKVIFFYGGNIGHAQDMGNLLRLARSMKEITNAHFLFLGQGDEVDLVKETIESQRLSNTTLLASVSQERYKQILTQVDVGLFSLAASHKTHNFPGKLLGYMVESLPILGSINEGNDLSEFITDADAGFILVNGQDAEFFEAAKILAVDEKRRKQIGNNANRLLATHFSVESAANTIISNLKL
ncbi:glycosyltransferase family 4 protein [Psychromonas aquimarina]|uniref:glycosyltransferase family 4 protein n=1 Tax=Psychromonas aquimarina TaxID=444919 RepID=UPI000404A057|nr:glycosyltransferase family 4 protein [Psychromonas aquimarina]